MEVYTWMDLGYLCELVLSIQQMFHTFLVLMLNWEGFHIHITMNGLQRCLKYLHLGLNSHEL